MERPKFSGGKGKTSRVKGVHRERLKTSKVAYQPSTNSAPCSNHQPINLRSCRFCPVSALKRAAFFRSDGYEIRRNVSQSFAASFQYLLRKSCFGSHSSRL